MKKQILFLVLALCSTISFSQIKVLSDGKVGMGTAVPYTQLHLYNSSNNGPQITLSAPLVAVVISE